MTHFPAIPKDETRTKATTKSIFFKKQFIIDQHLSEFLVSADFRNYKANEIRVKDCGDSLVSAIREENMIGYYSIPLKKCLVLYMLFLIFFHKVTLAIG